MNSFTDTFILEANRVHSSQYTNSSNTSIWTNAVNDGIELNEGDRVQLHSAFVSDLGAEDATIEFRGKVIQDEVVLQKTILTQPEANASLNYPNYYGLAVADNASQTFKQITDNRVLFGTEYYKNANGEYYFTLPLEYGNIYSDGRNAGWLEGPEMTITNTSFTAANGKGAVTLPPLETKRLKTDWTDVQLPVFTTENGNTVSSNPNFVQIANDNSRYTLYRLRSCERELVISTPILARDPAAQRYLRIKDIVDFEVAKGFNSPQNIASQFTEEMTKSTLSELKQYEWDDTEKRMRSKRLSTKINSPTYKLFECATPEKFSYDNAASFFAYNAFQYSNLSPTPTEALVHYAAQYEIIGKKRPNFYDTGAEMMDKIDDGSGINPDAPPGETLFSLLESANPNSANGLGQLDTDFTYITIGTNLEYNASNLELIKDFFDSQDNYPELFDIEGYDTLYTTETDGIAEWFDDYGEKISQDTHRLFHINPYENDEMPYVLNGDSDNMTEDRQRHFGSDNYHNRLNASGQANTPYKDYSSFPFFVKYKPAYKDSKDVDGILYDEETGRGMWGGFAIRVPTTYGSTDKSLFTNIGFLAQIPKGYTKEVGSKKYLTYGSNRHIGFDKHFNSYGNATICLFNGLNTKFGWSQDRRTVVRNADFNMTEQYNSNWYNQVYIGATSPLFNFDDSKSRFFFSDLHTNEVIDTPANTSLTGLPDDAGTKVYKFNKSLGYKNFTPTMAPYSVSMTYPTATVDDITYSNKHAYIVAEKVYDSLSGIFLTNFGIDRDNWNNSFWGICGFDYDDLNLTGGNTQQRITTNNTSGLSSITTNADVLPSAQLGFSSIAQGAPSYLPQLNTLKTVITGAQNANANPGPPYLNYLKIILELQVPTQVEATSAQIVAKDLPTKTLRPYYTIRSDIIGDSNFFGGKNEPSVMPVIAVLDKMNQYGDFFYSGGAGQITFTITQKKTITEVKTQICDPSGEPAILSPNSCVMYKIIKNNNANLNVIGDIIAQEQKKK